MTWFNLAVALFFYSVLASGIALFGAERRVHVVDGGVLVRDGAWACLGVVMRRASMSRDGRNAYG